MYILYIYIFIFICFNIYFLLNIFFYTIKKGKGIIFLISKSYLYQINRIINCSILIISTYQYKPLFFIYLIIIKNNTPNQVENLFPI